MFYTNTSPNIPILFEDDYIILIDKPVDLLSQADHTGDPDVVSLIKVYLRRKKNNPFIGLIHRLDRPVGGLLLIAKTKKAANNLSQQMKDRLIQKTYWTVTAGTPPQNGVLNHYLRKNKSANTVKTVSASDKKGKHAVLSFAVLERSDRLNLISVHLQTGRPHQIRVQMATEGYPIWGDYKYGKDQPDGRTMALRSVELMFRHPIHNEEVRFELPPPEDFPWSHFNNIVYD